MLGVLDRHRLSRIHAQALQRREVEAGIGLGQWGVFAADHAVPVARDPQPLQVATHPFP